MDKSNYLKEVFEAYNNEKISAEAYDAAVMNAEEFEDAYDEEEDDCPSSTSGDYSPSCPWNAPGMSIRDFI